VIQYLDSFPVGLRFNTRRHSEKRVRSLAVHQTTMAVLGGITVAVQVLNSQSKDTKEWYSERSYLNYGGGNKAYDQSDECCTHAGVLSSSYDLQAHHGLMGTMYDERSGVLFCIKGYVANGVRDDAWLCFDAPHYHYVSIIGTCGPLSHSEVLSRHAHWYCWCSKFTSANPKNRLKCELVERLTTSKRFLNSMTKWHAFAAAWDAEPYRKIPMTHVPRRDRAIPDSAFGVDEFKRLTKVITRMPAEGHTVACPPVVHEVNTDPEDESDDLLPAIAQLPPLTLLPQVTQFSVVSGPLEPAPFSPTTAYLPEDFDPRARKFARVDVVDLS